ncbi:hypothetical protein EHQ68_07245 [Leptospira congkakensis]|uniref:Phospholipase n=1 Tax=Leptospira congkakensis TaxID=2484932 RepID=A0A4Z1AH13_9LEPT|nr:hypothetical protein [Leptospira congkakensis]TGL87597.1 hypothetical protein EHQ69_15915 [Leptospira congkakensis]TGL89788.1 hypothetical protein EHQ68_07245 [Leptospira congkakensis]TGL95747.1 hypothetical protein EHQ70_11585 [Leptospira congkakensis]
MKQFIVSFVILTFALPIFSWNNHAGITYLILKDHWKGQPTPKVKVESLKSFLSKEKSSIQETLSISEEWALKKLPHLTPTIESLKFSKTTKEAELVVSFYKALRVNPNHKAALYIQSVPKRSGTKLPLDNLTTLKEKGKLVNETFLALQEGQMIGADEVLVSATDEPDYDLDLYLFEDNGSEVGKIYGFGSQPFGNPAIEFSSQAPFHMGFYYEPGIIFALAGFLKQTYPEYRIHQFTELSNLAFRTGHPYWGYRFAGWALHYIQDLTQPYHSSVLPRVSAAKQIGVQLVSILGYQSPKNDMINFISGRHTLIEEYQYYLIRNLIETKNWNHSVASSITGFSSVDQTKWQGMDSLRENVCKEAYKAGEPIDEQLEYLEIPKYETLYEPNHPIHTILGSLLHNTSKHTRAYLDALKTN